MLYDERDNGGTDGIHPSKPQGPMGFIDQPLNIQLQGRGLDVPFMDAHLKLDPDSWEGVCLVGLTVITEIIPKEFALSRTRRVSYNTID